MTPTSHSLYTCTEKFLVGIKTKMFTLHQLKVKRLDFDGAKLDRPVAHSLHTNAEQLPQRRQHVAK